MTFGEFFDNLWQALPGTDIIYHLSKRPNGLSPHDYAGFACSADECRNTPIVGILRCKKEIAIQAATWIAEWIGISTFADFIKVIAGAIISAVAGGTGVGLAVGVALAAIGIADAAIVQKKANQIASAAASAQTIYCACGWEGPAPA